MISAEKEWKITNVKIMQNSFLNMWTVLRHFKCCALKQIKLRTLPRPNATRGRQSPSKIANLLNNQQYFFGISFIIEAYFLLDVFFHNKKINNESKKLEPEFFKWIFGCQYKMCIQRKRI